MAFNEKTTSALDAIVARYPTRQSALLPVLRHVEREAGELNDKILADVAAYLGLPPARVMGVVSFYTHFRRPGDGRYVIHVCGTLPCALRKSEALLAAISRHLGIRVGETTADGRFTLRRAECLAACDLAPAVAINDEIHGPMTPETLVALLERLS